MGNLYHFICPNCGGLNPIKAIISEPKHIPENQICKDCECLNDLDRNIEINPHTSLVHTSTKQIRVLRVIPKNQHYTFGRELYTS